MRISNRGGRGVLPLFLLLSFMAFNVYAGGDGDSSVTFDPKTELATAEKLFDEKRLDKALKAVVEIARTDPEQMERVQKLVLKIQEIKNLINDLFAEANAAAARGDSARVAEIIREILELDKEPNRDLQDKLLSLKKSVEKNENNRVRDTFFDSGNRLLAAEDYTKAVSEYRKGFIGDPDDSKRQYTETYFDYIQRAQGRLDTIIYYPENPERDYLVKQAYGTLGLEGEGIVNSLNTALDEWNDNNRQLPAAAESLSALISTSPVDGWAAGAAGLERNFSTALEDVARVRKLTADLDLIWKRLVSALEGTPEDFYYERIGQFMNGRIGEDHNGTVELEQEGILLAMELQWESSFLSAADAMYGRIGGILSGARSDYLANKWDTAGSGFGNASLASDELLRFLKTSDIYLASEQGDTNRFTEPAGVLSAYGQYVSTASKIWSELAALDRTPNVTEAVAQAAVDQVTALIKDWDATESKLASLPGAGAAAVRNVDANLQRDLSETLDQFQKRLLGIFLGEYKSVYQRLEIEAAAALAVDLVVIRTLVNRDLAGENPVRRPIFALNSLIVPALSKLNSLEKSLVDFDNRLEKLLNRRPPLANPEELQNYQKSAQRLLPSTVGLRDDLLKEEQSATDFAILARKAEVKAKKVLDNVLANLNSAAGAVALGERTDDINQFNRAVDLYNAVDNDLDDVDRLYLEVMANDRDLGRSSGLEENINNLRTRTQVERGRVAEAVKQNAIEEARTAYGEARYSYANIVLTQAQEFWKRTYNEEDLELAGWIRRVDNALKALERTVIPPEDPLFPEMNQYLNLANRYYREALLFPTRSSDWATNLNKANELLGQVLLVFPGNRAALSLQRRIELARNEDAFNKWAAELVRNAEKAIRDSKVEATRKEAVVALQEGPDGNSGIISELLILKEVRPVYPNLGNLIDRCLEALQDPPDIDGSKLLYNEALAKWDPVEEENFGGSVLTTRQRKIAVECIVLLNDAITLWPKNEKAIELGDIIRRRLIPLPPLPPRLEDLIDQFYDFYDRQNEIGYKKVLNTILNDYPSWRNDPRIRELIIMVGGD